MQKHINTYIYSKNKSSQIQTFILNTYLIVKDYVAHLIREANKSGLYCRIYIVMCIELAFWRVWSKFKNPYNNVATCTNVKIPSWFIESPTKSKQPIPKS